MTSWRSEVRVPSRPLTGFDSSLANGAARCLLVVFLSLLLLALWSGCETAPGETIVLTITARAARATDPPATASAPAPAVVPKAVSPAAPSAAPPVVMDGRPGRIVEVVDGDTLRVELDGEIVSVRLIGIDAPELDDRAGQSELADQAHAALEALLAGASIEMMVDAEPRQSPGDRLLRHALRDGVNVAQELARQGWARALERPPNLLYRAPIAAAVAEARRNRRGIWAAATDGLTLAVDKEGEIVTLHNASSESIDLTGWWLVSLRGGQAFRFPGGTVIGPGARLRVTSGERAGKLQFGARNVWNNQQRDSAELRRPDGRVASYWDDPDPT